MKKTYILMVSAILSLIILSCKQGEQGDIGPAGIAGTKGATGDKGDVGITNSKGMLVTSWYEAKPTEWTLFTSTTNSYYLELTHSSFTKEIANKGGIYTYMQPVNSTSVYPLPYSEVNVLSMFSNTSYINNVPYIQYRLKFNATNAKVTSNYKLRWVVVPAAARISADIDWNNYEEVKKYLNLND